MTIRLTWDECEEQFQEASEEKLQFDPSDELDVTLKYDARYARGWLRRIDLREGIQLEIDKSQSTDSTIVNFPEYESSYITCYFTLSGNGQGTIASRRSEILYPYTTGKYWLRSCGLNPQIIEGYDIKPWFSVIIYIHQSILRSFETSPKGELSKNLQNLIRPLSQKFYVRSGNIEPMMFTVLQQILHCPYQGMVKRAYLESKVIELMALVLDHEVVIQQGEAKKVSLKPEQIERIHYARELILQNLSKPLSEAELSSRVGLNEFLLKRGFNHCFGTSPWKMGREERLETAKRLLAEQDISVTEVAYRVGYANLCSFSEAFKRKFDISPKKYQKKWR